MKSPTEIAAQLWCLPRHSHKVMDPDLAHDIAAEIQAEREAAKVLVSALEEAQCELFRIAEAPWDIHQAQVAAASGRYRLGERLARYKEMCK